MKFADFSEFFKKVNQLKNNVLYVHHHWFNSRKLEEIPIFPRVRIIQKREDASGKANRYYIEYEYVMVAENALGFQKKKRFTESLSVRPEAYEHMATRGVYTKTPSHRSTIDSNGRFLLCYELREEHLTIEQFNTLLKEVEEEARQFQITTEHYSNFEDYNLLPRYNY